MNFWLRNAIDRFDLLTIRERVLVLVAVIAVAVVAWDTVFAAPSEKERKQRQGQVVALRAEVSGLEQSIQVLAAQSDAGPDPALRDEIRKIRKELPELEARLSGATTGLIGPEEMTQVLRQMLRQAARLNLRALRTLEATPVLSEVQGAAPSQPGTRIFKHGLELELGGSYLDVLHFLQSMEALQWRFFWDRIEFQVEQHPRARVRLVIYTLSLEEGWIGV